MTLELALQELTPGLQKIYGDLVDSIILYGSAARRIQTEDSDVDVAILLHSGATKVMREQMLDLVVDMEECLPGCHGKPWFLYAAAADPGA